MRASLGPSNRTWSVDGRSRSTMRARPGPGSPHRRCRRPGGGSARSGRGTPARAGRRARRGPRSAPTRTRCRARRPPGPGWRSRRPRPDVRRSSCAMTSDIGTANASATATGIARSRNTRSRSSATRGPMMLPTRSERRRERDHRCHATSLPPVGRRCGARLRRGHEVVVPAAESGRSRVPERRPDRGRGGVRRRVVRALAAHRARRLGRHGVSVVARSGSPSARSPPRRRREFAQREDNTRAQHALPAPRRRAR